MWTNRRMPNYDACLMQHRSLFLVAWLTLVSCTPSSREYVTAGGTDVSTFELQPDAGEQPSPIEPDADVQPSLTNSDADKPPSPRYPDIDEIDGRHKDGGSVVSRTDAGGATGEEVTDACSPNPCVHGTCTDLVGDFSCTCAAGWGGERCDTGSCSNVTCPESAPCRVPSENAGICYPKACATDGLCLAENADGSGAARVFGGRNDDFGEYDWGNRARYFAYIDEIHGPRACVFPQIKEGGTPLVIPLGTKATKSSGFGLSNSWPSDACK